jgi:hypothetical protein
MNISSSISDRIAVIAEPQFAQYMSGIATTYINEKPLLIVLAERKLTDSEHRQSCNGVRDALEHAEANAEQNVLLLSFFKLELLIQRKEDTALFLQLPNAFFAELPMKAELVLEKHDNTDEVRKIAGKALASLVFALNHTTEKYVGATEESVAAMLAERAAEVKRVQTYFPELRNLSGKAFITELKKLRDALPVAEAMPGKEIAGVYCDIEGTLLIDGVLQETILAQLHDYAAQGSQVTIWTLGNVAELEPIIRNAGVQYPVRSKMDYSGAIAEIVIDNDSEETFRAKTRITPKQFIQV